MTMQPTEYPDNLEEPTVSSPTCTSLLCCPFCLGVAIEVDDALSARFGYQKSVKCTSCSATHINAKRWNNRPASKTLRAT